jgi:hypothetical protein
MEGSGIMKQTNSKAVTQTQAHRRERMIRIGVAKRVLCPVCKIMPSFIIGRRYYCSRCESLFEFEECSSKTITRKARRRRNNETH